MRVNDRREKKAPGYEENTDTWLCYAGKAERNCLNDMVGTVRFERTTFRV